MMRALFDTDKIMDFKPIFQFLPENVSFIDESLGSFDGQYGEAEKLTKAVVFMLMNGMSRFEGKFIINGKDIPIEIRLDIGTMMGPSADIAPYGIGKKIEKLVMTVKVPRFDILSDYEGIERRIASIISHELMHGNIFHKLAANNQDIDDSEKYGPIVKALNKYTHQSLEENILYAMYASYYQERQAIISSTYSQLCEILPDEKLKGIGINSYEKAAEIFKRYLVETDAYRTYYYISNVVCEKVFSLSDTEVKIIESKLGGFGIRLERGIKKEFEKIKGLSDGALKDVIRNGTLFFYDKMAPLCKNH